MIVVDRFGAPILRFSILACGGGTGILRLMRKLGGLGAFVPLPIGEPGA